MATKNPSDIELASFDVDHAYGLARQILERHNSETGGVSQAIIAAAIIDRLNGSAGVHVDELKICTSST